MEAVNPQQSRKANIDELVKWAKGKPLGGIESILFSEAKRRFLCTPATARAYAESVRMALEMERAQIAPVQ